MAKILVIDDDPDMVLAVRMCLEDAGHVIRTAHNGKSGLEAMRAERPDLVILDVMMDTSTEGFELALKIRNPDPMSSYADLRDIPLLMLTAIHSTTPLRYNPEVDYLPVELFIDKPIDPDDLVQKVAWVLTREQA